MITIITYTLTTAAGISKEMNYTKTNPVGIDKRITEAQNFLYPRLKNAWGLNDDTLNLYGRVYRDQKDGGAFPEFYVGGGEYREILLNDTTGATCFFGQRDTVKSDIGYNTTEVFFVSLVNLDIVKNGVGRLDEEAKQDVLLEFNKYLNGFKLVSTQTGIDNVFSEYPGWKKKYGTAFRDVQPFYNFKVNLEVTYKIKV
jgi:hypothetical protein